MLVPKLRFKREDGTDYSAWNNQKLSAVSSRVTRKNKGNITDIPLTIASLYGLVDQREYFKKTIASQNMEGYYLLHNGEFAYNKSYSKGFDFGAIKRLDRYDYGALSTLYICFAVNDKVNSDFMTHYFDSQKWNKEVSIRCAEGARNHGLLNISTDDFFDVDMILPTDIEEQQKIADFLSTVDEVIAQSEAEVQNLEQQKKAAMQKVFSQEVRFKREDGAEYPEWEEKEVRDCLAYEQPTKYIVKSEQYNDNYETPVLTANKGFILGYTNEKDGIYNKGDVIIYDDFTMDMKYVWFAFKVKSSAMKMLTAINDNNLYFMYSLLVSHNLHQEVHSRSYISQVEPMLVQIPCLEEQQKIADFLSAYDEAISYAKQEIEHWKQLKKGLLQQMFV